MKVCPKTDYRLFPTITGRRTKKGLPMKFEILGLVDRDQTNKVNDCKCLGVIIDENVTRVRYMYISHIT